MGEDSEQAESMIAACMRQALDQAAWSPEDDPEEAISVLLRMCAAIASLTIDEADLEDLTAARVMVESHVLADVYLFSAQVRKTIDQQHLAQPVGRAEQPRAEFVRQVASVLSDFRRRRQELAEALDQAYPSES